ncbi:hypothetical protein [Leptospira paudalimensis]|uniref:Lipoprotein n=1 Tax=Leptospira paudalimensis TaxID=2950024 RepID=A0ABT3M3D6_9LEPT|nr:hypothetical protein [Leptospira paudalimensis]MCW7502888.1 hypothetical protein [Leptospira paudalimensis]
MKTKYVIVIFLFIGSSSCKKPMFGKDWIDGPAVEEIAPGIFYMRDKFVEKDFIKYEIDPRAITMKDILPFVKELKLNIEMKNFGWIINNTTFRGDLSSKLLGYRDSEDVMDVWVDEYKKNRRDPYCDFDLLFKSPLNKLEIKMKEVIKVQKTDDNTKYTLYYNIKIYFPLSDYPLSLNVITRSSFFPTPPFWPPYNAIKEFVGHCPEPNFEPYSTDPSEKD